MGLIDWAKSKLGISNEISAASAGGDDSAAMEKMDNINRQVLNDLQALKAKLAAGAAGDDADARNQDRLRRESSGV